LRKEEQNGWHEPLIANSSRAILFPFARKILALKCFVRTVACDAEGGRIVLFDPQNEKTYKVAKERVQSLNPPGRGT
jgi:hypothetical protein